MIEFCGKIMTNSIFNAYLHTYNTNNDNNNFLDGNKQMRDHLQTIGMHSSLPLRVVHKYLILLW